MRTSDLGSPLLRRSVLAAFLALHILFVLAPADVLAPVDPWRVGQMVWQGHIPYRDFPLEYPPGSVLAFLLPGAVPHGLAPLVLALQAVVAEAAVMWFVLRRVDGALWRWVPLSMLVFPFLSGGFDALPMAAIAGSTALIAKGAASGWWLAGAGAVVKLVPGVAWLWGRPLRRDAIGALMVSGAVLLVPVVLARHSDDAYLGYSLHRGVQVESVGASTAWLSQKLNGDDSRFFYRFKSYEIDGADGYAAFWALAGFGGLAAVAIRASRGGGIDPWLGAFIALVLLLIANKVLSPQFVAWPAPLAAVLGGRWFRAWLVIAALTLAAYVGEGPTWILSFAALRNAALVIVAATGLRELWTAQAVPRGA